MDTTILSACLFTYGWFIAPKVESIIKLMFFNRDGNSGGSGSGHWWIGKEHD